MKSSLTALLDEAAHAPFEGWDFGWLDGRAYEAQPPWQYSEELARVLRTAECALDVDTGGGEILARLDARPPLMVATEGYYPNVPVAARELRPFGVYVIGVKSAPDNVDQLGTTPAHTSSHLPFHDGTFDAGVDRHSSFWPSEVYRVLRPGGVFLTQQRDVGGDQLLSAFGRDLMEVADYDLAFATRQLQDAGMEIARAEDAATPVTFFDIGAVAYFLRAVPWVVPNFDVGQDREVLAHLHEQIDLEGNYVVDGSHLLIEARRP